MKKNLWEKFHIDFGVKKPRSMSDFVILLIPKCYPCYLGNNLRYLKNRSEIFKTDHIGLK